MSQEIFHGGGGQAGAIGNLGVAHKNEKLET